MTGVRFGRRRLLTTVAGVAAGVGLPSVLTGCLAGDDGPVGHPGLAAPLGHAVITQLQLPAAEAAGALRALAAGVRRLPEATPGVLALASTAFDAVGRADRRPAGLRVMPTFTGDVPMAERVGADLLLQVEGDSPGAAAEATDRLLAGVPGVAVRSRLTGERPENTVRDGRALTRNGFGFVEGWANPGRSSRPDAAALTLITAGEAPEWAVGGSYLALRVVRLAHDLWDRDPVPTQEAIIGRRRDGAWLDGTPADGVPDFAADPDGRITPLDAHVRRADPRTPGSTPPPLVRRSWSYDAGDVGGQPDRGILFMCYQRDLAAGFEAVQARLAGQALDLYLLTVGGGYFLLPPADRGDRRW